MFRKQPEITVELTKNDKKIILVGWLFLILNVLLTAVFYADLPEKIPTHFNFKGEVNGYGHKSTIWILSILGMLMYYGLNLIIKKVPTHKFNYPVTVTDKNAPRMYRLSLKMMVTLNVSITLLFLLLSLHTILAAKDIVGPNLLQIVLIGVILITILPFFFMYKMFKIPK